MKILISYIFCTKGGVETAIKNRLKGIDRNKCQCDLLFLYDYGGKSIFEDLDCNVFVENQKEKIERIIKENCYDVVLSIDTKEVLEILKEMKYEGKVGLEVHTTYEKSLTYLENMEPGLASFIVVPSEYEKKLVLEKINLDLPVFVLPNAIDTEIFVPKKWERISENKIILWVGRLDVHKNWRLFLKIAKEMYVRDDKYEFWIVGGLKAEKNEWDEFQKQIYELGLYNCLRWLPMVEYRSMANIYSYVGTSGGGYVITSKNESFGMTVLEAMACSCPVIANKVGALEELVDSEKSGKLIEFSDIGIEKSAEIVDMYLKNKKLVKECNEFALSYVNREFSSKSIGGKFAEILEKV